MIETIAAIVSIITGLGLGSLVRELYRRRKRDLRLICCSVAKRTLAASGRDLPRASYRTIKTALSSPDVRLLTPQPGERDLEAWRPFLRQVIEPLARAHSAEAITSFRQAFLQRLALELKRIDVWRAAATAVSQAYDQGIEPDEYWLPVAQEPDLQPLAYPIVQEIAGWLPAQQPSLVHLQGPLGSGKTCLLLALPKVLSEITGQDWHVARLRRVLDDSSVMEALRAFGVAAQGKRGVIVLDEAYDTECRLPGGDLCRSLSVLLRELPKVSLRAISLVVSVRPDTEVPTDLLPNAHFLDVKRRGMISQKQVPSFLGQYRDLRSGVSAEEIEWIRTAFFVHQQRIEPIHLQAYVTYRQANADYRGFVVSPDVAESYQRNVFSTLSNASQHLWGLLALLHHVFDGSLWHSPIPEWLLPIAWELAGLTPQDLPAAQHELLHNEILRRDQTTNGQTSLSFGHDAYAALPILPSMTERLASDSGATDIAHYCQLLARTIEGRVLGLLVAATKRSAGDIRDSFEAALHMYVVRSALGPDAWPAFFERGAFREAARRAVHSEADLEPVAGVARLLVDRCHGILSTPSTGERPLVQDPASRLRHARSLLLAFLEMQAAMEAPAAALRPSMAPVVADLFPAATTRWLFDQLATAMGETPFARPTTPSVFVPAGSEDAELAYLRKQVRAAYDRRELLWAHLVAEDSGANFRDRYCFLVGRGDAHTYDALGEAAPAYLQAAALASKSGYPLLELAACLSAAGTYLTNGMMNEFQASLRRCLEINRGLCESPGWFESYCGELLQGSGIQPDAESSKWVQEGKAWVAEQLARPGQPIILVGSPSDRVCVYLIAHRLAGRTSASVRPEVTQQAYEPDQVETAEPSALIVIGSVFTVNGGLIRRYLPAEKWYPWRSATPHWRSIERVDSERFQVYAIAGRMGVDTLLAAQEFADNECTLREVGAAAERE